MSGSASGTGDRTRVLVTAAPGLAPLAGRELGRLEGVRVTDTGNDGRADVLLCEVDGGRTDRLTAARSIEDAFVEVGRTLRSEGDRAQWIARRLWRPNRVQRALGAWSRARARRPRSGKGHSGSGLTYRVVVRVLQERSFKRTDLRRVLTKTIGTTQPRWRAADPAALEVWVVEYAAGRFVAGLRLSTKAMRQHDGRAVERSGALRPSVAAAMVALAGASKATLLDPCCGSGTILAEARALGWSRTTGRDIDTGAVEASRTNAPGSTVARGDARELDLADGSVDACVSNLPFGRQYDVDGDPSAWLGAVLRELARVTRSGGQVVLCVPKLPRSAIPPGLALEERFPLRLLGTTTTIWRLRRS